MKTPEQILESRAGETAASILIFIEDHLKNYFIPGRPCEFSYDSLFEKVPLSLRARVGQAIESELKAYGWLFERVNDFYEVSAAAAE